MVQGVVIWIAGFNLAHAVYIADPSPGSGTRRLSDLAHPPGLETLTAIPDCHTYW